MWKILILQVRAFGYFDSNSSEKIAFRTQNYAFAFEFTPNWLADCDSLWVNIVTAEFNLYGMCYIQMLTCLGVWLFIRKTMKIEDTNGGVFRFGKVVT